MALALNTYLKDPSSIADAEARDYCAAAEQAILGAFAGGRVFMGKYDTRVGDVNHHRAAYDPASGFIHVDPMYYQDMHVTHASEIKAGQEMTLSLIHEGLHSLGFDHPGQSVPYASGPFRHFNGWWDTDQGASGTPSPCVQW